jgi:hypothetical protein
MFTKFVLAEGDQLFISIQSGIVQVAQHCLHSGFDLLFIARITDPEGNEFRPESPAPQVPS